KRVPLLPAFPASMQAAGFRIVGAAKAGWRSAHLACLFDLSAAHHRGRLGRGNAECARQIGSQMNDWYLIRTKPGAERRTQENLKHVVDQTLLPHAKTQLRQGDRIFQRISPIFPCYIFAYFSLAHAARQIRYTPGVRNIVEFGGQAAPVPAWVIDELVSRCS